MMSLLYLWLQYHSKAKEGCHLKKKEGRWGKYYYSKSIIKEIITFCDRPHGTHEVVHHTWMGNFSHLTGSVIRYLPKKIRIPECFPFDMQHVSI